MSATTAAARLVEPERVPTPGDDADLSGSAKLPKMRSISPYVQRPGLVRAPAPRVCVLVSGKRYAGKDHVANAIARAVPGAERRSFAAQLKRDCAELFALDYARLMDDAAYKEQHRALLIRHGSDMRAVDIMHWARRVAEAAATDAVTVVSDDRFPNERQFMREQGLAVITVRVRASDDVRRSRGWTPNATIDADASECALDDVPCDFVVDNNMLGAPDVAAIVAAVEAARAQ